MGQHLALLHDYQQFLAGMGNLRPHAVLPRHAHRVAALEPSTEVRDNQAGSFLFILARSRDNTVVQLGSVAATFIMADIH